MSYKRARNAEEKILRGIEKSRETAGTNGIGLSFALREKPDWRLLLAFQYGRNGRRIEVAR